MLVSVPLSDTASADLGAIVMLVLVIIFVCCVIPITCICFCCKCCCFKKKEGGTKVAPDQLSA
jgi:hypothetical protein